MTQTTKTGLYLLPAALALGLTGDVLLRETPWGLNVLLWTCALIGVFGLLSRSARHQFSGEGIWLAAPALVLAGCLAWRDSPTLRTLDIIGLVGCLGIGAARTTAGQVHLSGLLEYLAETLRSVFLSVFGGFPLLFKEIAWDTVPRGGWLPRTLSALRGLLLVLPLLLLFGALLS